MYKNFNRIYKKIILIILISYRINAKTYDCLTLCCHCLFENKVKNEIGNKSADEIEIKNFFKTYNLNKNYKKDEIKSENSLLEPTLENYINAFKDIDNRLGDYFKENIYKFIEIYSHPTSCLFHFLRENNIKNILKIGDYLVTFNSKDDSLYKKDLEEALSIDDDDEIKYFSKRIKTLKEKYNGKKNYYSGYYYYLLSDIYIYSTKDNKYIGGITFKSSDPNKGLYTFNIAYWLNYNYRGLGIMSVIVPTICKYFFTRIKEIKGYSICWDKENSKSVGLAKKTCIFIRTGHEKEYEIEEEDYKEEERISITKK